MVQKTITTKVDGEDVQRVNAWNSPKFELRKRVKGYFKEGDVVDVMNEQGDYVEIRGTGYKYDTDLRIEVPDVQVRGWTHRLFLVENG